MVLKLLDARNNEINRKHVNWSNIEKFFLFFAKEMGVTHSIEIIDWNTNHPVGKSIAKFKNYKQLKHLVKYPANILKYIKNKCKYIP